MQATTEQALERLPLEELVELFVSKRKRRGQIFDLYPDKGPRRRALYKKHLEAFALGKECMVRAVQSGNAVGKTYGLGGYEVVLHLTGLYPDWWPGHRYNRATRWWAAGDTKEETRDTVQTVLFGEPGEEGTGLIPGDCIEEIKWRSSKAIDYALIRHVTGQTSSVGLKAYEQKAKSFRGSNKDGVWLDEPPPYDVYSESMARLRDSDYPMMILTYTPMDGITEMTLEMEKESPERRLITIGWDDVPHLSEAWKSSQLANTKPHLRETRKLGIPAIGEGAVFPVDLETITCDPLERIPAHWPRLYGFDGGWHNTAALWGAYDRDSDTIYLYSEYKRGEQPIAVHAAAINARGKWIPGVGDAAAVNQSDGESLIDEYHEHGVKLRLADKHEKSAAIDNVLERLLTGRLKLYGNLTSLIQEIRQYRYEDGKIVKDNDHLVDAMIYLVRHIDLAKTQNETTAASRRVPEKRFGHNF